MASYRLFFIENSEFQSGASFEADNDVDAGQIVRQRQLGRLAELWDEERCVGVFAPSRRTNAPPNEVRRPSPWQAGHAT